MFAVTAFAGSLFGDWPQFRGPNASGIAVGPAPPVEFGPGKNVLWRTPLAAGHSSPCVAEDAIYLTTYREKQKKLAVVCIARESGISVGSGTSPRTT